MHGATRIYGVPRGGGRHRVGARVVAAREVIGRLREEVKVVNVHLPQSAGLGCRSRAI